MFASAAPLTFPPVTEPPMITMSRTKEAMEGSLEAASAIFVSGPTGINVSSCGYLCAISMMRSGPKRASALHFEAGDSILAMPELRGDQFLVERVLRPGRNNDIATSRQGHDLQSILQALCGIH